LRTVPRPVRLHLGDRDPHRRRLARRTEEASRGHVRAAGRQMIVLTVTWKAKLGQEAETERLFRLLADQSRKEPGCLMFQLHRHTERPGEFFLYEQYQDEAALEAHRNTTHFKELARGALLKVADRIDATLYQPLL